MMCGVALLDLVGRFNCAFVLDFWLGEMIDGFNFNCTERDGYFINRTPSMEMEENDLGSRLQDAFIMNWRSVGIESVQFIGSLEIRGLAIPIQLLL